MNTDHNKGHRSRLRERFRKGGMDALQDYEFIELVLFRAIPRRDVKPLAKNLIARFGDVSGILGAAPQRLKEVEGVTENIVTELKIVEAAGLQLGKSKIMHRTPLNSWEDLIAYCRAQLVEKTIEEFHVIFLDKKQQVMANELMGRGTVDHAPVYTREVIKRALELDATSLILVHNHPSGDPLPSKADIDMTHKIQKKAAEFGISLHDHIVIGRSKETSFRDTGILV